MWTAAAGAVVAGGAFALQPADEQPGSAIPPSGARSAAAVRPALAALERDAARLLDGGVPAFRRRLADLRGVPVVVNQWASWCGPCRYEFPFFQRLAKRYRGRVAFLGVNSQDVRDDAREFLREFPTPFPHYYDEHARVAREFAGGRAWPTTAYYAADGRLARTHPGSYASEGKLEADVRRWALRG